MIYKQSPQQMPSGLIKPRLIIHGGAGNVRADRISPEKYAAYRHALLSIVSQTSTYMTTPSSSPKSASKLPSALDTATYAVTLLENNPLFNSGHGAVFTRDGINELEASVMVSRGYAKRGVGVMGLRRIKNPILLAKTMLERGDEDLWGNSHPSTAGANDGSGLLDIPSAQGHTQLHGPTAEQLAVQYGFELVDPAYFFTQTRWDEHVHALEREKEGKGFLATWHPEEYLPQGTVGAVALDENGVVCAATSTGGLTNKLTGRIGDTPTMGAGFWAEEWEERGDPSKKSVGPTRNGWDGWRTYLGLTGPVVELSSSLKAALADCLPNPLLYSPVPQNPTRAVKTIRSMAVSGTGNGDSFLRTAAVKTVAAIARYGVMPTSEALHQVTGDGGELQKSAGDRWGQTGEGEGGMIGIECVIVRDEKTGDILETRGEVLQDYNSAGMWRAWIDEAGNANMLAWDGKKDKEKIEGGNPLH
ncbi:nucleophile aminohydrolase [Pseudomassariella vexata]|uniref:Nucleophile aminohydrolase n=1 Tax=Pseudomassariella vexata TaxID=1141098 RepID=A0A1Y2DR47_9PEZI|nr:nucleophile aminohydrolase [Pseudomassariella vexata]ORY61773.1 nucleophile aminohydrolase [Pseudomassariella vexata]